VDVVWPHGAGVLNADDANAVSMVGYCDGAITLYSPSADSPALVSHLKERKRAVTVEQGSIVLAQGDQREVVLSLDALADHDHLTSDTAAIGHYLAAIAAAWALAIPVQIIRSALLNYREG